MWVVAVMLLGAVVVGALAGLHVGPHGHVAAGIVGALAAAWLLFMAADGRGGSLLFSLLAADVVFSAGLGVLAWKGLTQPAMAPRSVTPEGAEGVAVGDLDPLGIVRVRGEDWSAESVNGRVASGSPVQVIGREGMRLQVWDEGHDALTWSDADRNTDPAPGEPGGSGSGTSLGVPAVESEVAG